MKARLDCIYVQCLRCYSMVPGHFGLANNISVSASVFFFINILRLKTFLDPFLPIIVKIMDRFHITNYKYITNLSIVNQAQLRLVRLVSQFDEFYSTQLY